MKSTAARHESALMNTIELSRCIAGQILRRLPGKMKIDDLIHAGQMGAARYMAECMRKSKPSWPVELKQNIRSSVLDYLGSVTRMADDLQNLETNLAVHSRPGSFPKLVGEMLFKGSFLFRNQGLMRVGAGEPLRSVRARHLSRPRRYSQG